MTVAADSRRARREEEEDCHNVEVHVVGAAGGLGAGIVSRPGAGENPSVDAAGTMPGTVSRPGAAEKFSGRHRSSDIFQIVGMLAAQPNRKFRKV